ncbi:ArnT family glycosyltransferase [Methylovirgula sp. 4M-Z18]|uniref:ArnT family glycosyltransferase n=1 Tax=Methylovirgula sp. 4M-Z18 TaxID=2293567 RepID=UPI000E2EE53D|nr:glycosyltransferase family 39 protein [Methylovirgula sp. 4M-Z18]RFB80592.1 glycosyltransferase family 39 protein [Methylovirgula sp. 4M-Z18]
MISQSISHGSALVRLVIACLILFLVGFFTLPPMDRDEPRFAQASKQMIETGDLVTIHFQEEARLKKPVGIYWLQAGVVKSAEALGVPDAAHKIWLYRIPSLLGALTAVLLTYWAALAIMTRNGAYIAALLFASTILIGVEARLAKTDAVITATVVAAMGALLRVYLARREPLLKVTAGAGNAFIFWTALAIGILVKGPVTPMMPILAMLVLSIKDGDVSWLKVLRPARGLLWCLALVLPWFILITLKTHGAFFAESVGKDLGSKVAGGQESHGMWPGFYLAAFWATAWPMAPFAAVAAPFVWAQRRDPAVTFLLAWLVPAWLVFEAVPTKLPHYVLPLYPAIAILIALGFVRGAFASWRIWQKAVLVLLPIVALVVPGAAVFGIVKYDMAISPLTVVAGLVAAAVAAGAAGLLWRGQVMMGIFAAVLAAMALSATAYIGILRLPAFDYFALSPRLSAAVAAAFPAGSCDPEIAATSYHEPSLIFLTRTDLAITDGAGAATFLKQGGCRAALVEAKDEPAFQAALGPSDEVALATRIAGINLNGGHKLDIGVYVRH